MSDIKDEQLLRYSRQIMLPDIGVEGQERLLNSRVLLIGVGGLGSPIAIYLCSSGVGTITLVDDDEVDLSNLQRQIIHTTESIGKKKVLSAKEQLHKLNPDVEVIAQSVKLDEAFLSNEILKSHVVIDATDNIETRLIINKVCHAKKIPLISGAVIKTEGQVCIFPNNDNNDPCYNCLYGHVTESEQNCAETGVLGPVAGIIACVQATETIKLLAGIDSPLKNKLLIFNATSMELRTLVINKDMKCKVCN
jgi:adenylyltransferase/sulfurtransferase